MNQRDARILDVACGGGRLLQFYLDSGYTDVHGVDVSPEQVALARQVIPDVIQADVLDYLSEHAGRFDLISGLDIVEHFRDTMEAFWKDEARRTCKKCGTKVPKPGAYQPTWSC